MRRLMFLLYLTLWYSKAADGSNESAKEPAEVMSYSSMPELFGLDPYDQCMSRPGGAYSVLDVDLANVSGQLYDFITKYSSVTKKHYNHTRLHRGVCISERCGLTCDTVGRGTELLACINRTIFEQSGVEVGQVKVHYCNSAGQELAAPDTLDQSFAVVMAALVVLVVSGTIHHLMVREGWVKENQYAMAFSILKNWEILASGRTSNNSDTFRCLEGMRFLTMVIIISLHVVALVAGSYQSNPDFIEKSFDHPLTIAWLNIRVIVQTFFVMSGFLMAHQILKDIDRKPFSLARIPGSFIKRYIRFIPSVMVVVGLTATWVPRLNSGPLWNLIVRKEQESCRANWWRQLIFIQNQTPADQACLIQTWYIAADTQLHIIGLLLLVALSRYRHHGWQLFSAVLSVSLAAPALHTYIQNMLPIRASFFPETFLVMFEGNATFNRLYMSTQANWTGYTLGMLTAYVHHMAQRNRWDLANSVLLKRLFNLSLPLAACAVWFGAEFHTRPASRLEAVLFNALDHNVFAAAMCLFILGCIYKCDKFLRGCVEWAPLQPLGKLSFCAWLLHSSVLRTYMGHLPSLLHGSHYNVFFITLATAVITFVFSLFLYLAVEQPSCQLQKIFTNRSSGELARTKPCDVDTDVKED